MEQNSTKIVSLHLNPCALDWCPNRDVCYHVRKTPSAGSVEGVLPHNFRVEMLEQGYTIHESLCDKPGAWVWHLLDSAKNYYITIPCECLHPALYQFKDQIQVTVHTAEQARELLDWQKLFLIKDDETFQYAREKGMFNIPFSNTHFCINQDWITKEKLNELVYLRMLSNTVGTTIDSCAESFIINGRCPYQHGGYVDISYDGTLRTCPYNKVGVPISDVYDGSYESLFKVSCTPEMCKYSEIFAER